MKFFERLSEPTPEFFKLIQKIGASIAVIIAFFMALPAIGIDLPEWTEKVFNIYTLIMPLLPVFIAQLTSIWRKPDGTVDIARKNKYLDDEAEKAK